MSLQDSVMALQSTAAALPLVQTLQGAYGALQTRGDTISKNEVAHEKLLEGLWQLLQVDPKQFMAFMDEEFRKHGDIDKILKLTFQVSLLYHSVNLRCSFAFLQIHALP